MATRDNSGNVRARCPDCRAYSTFEMFHQQRSKYGELTQTARDSSDVIWYILHRCAGCGRGGMSTVRQTPTRDNKDAWTLIAFHPESMDTLGLPPTTPPGILNEFREAEKCMSAGCHRAAAAMLRSVIDKVLAQNGYSDGGLKAKIEQARKEGLITGSRARRMQEELRDLGNDVLHDEWRPVKPSEVAAAHVYASQLVHDFYEDRQTVEAQLVEAGRKIGAT